MKKGLIFSLSTVAVLSVSALGHMHTDEYSKKGMNQQSMMENNYSKKHMKDDRSECKMMKNNYSKYHMGYGMRNQGHMGQGMMHNSMMGDMMILPKIMMLDLSEKQQEKIRKILNSKVLNDLNPLDAFSDTSFDKDKYIKAVEKNREMMIKIHAEKISKIYLLLTNKQKKNLKKIIDVQNMYKNKNYNHMNNMMNR